MITPGRRPGRPGATSGSAGCGPARSPRLRRPAALLLAAGLALTGVREGRAAVTGLAVAVEAAVDTGLNGLAEALGMTLRHGRVLPADGALVNELLHKGR
ncbi:hypothetical protein [Streptomyces sp. NPDC126499]|uniref:hypothetical protein n=1 Tax=Streptomyces sp. NPDC126499 TaxID=3155314 RepID=UPI00331DF0BA